MPLRPTYNITVNDYSDFTETERWRADIAQRAAAAADAAENHQNPFVYDREAQAAAVAGLEEANRAAIGQLNLRQQELFRQYMNERVAVHAGKP